LKSALLGREKGVRRPETKKEELDDRRLGSETQ
jgi:hypothetical protein